MKNILITVSSITAGSGLSKYVCNLAKILSISDYKVTVLTTHGNDDNYEYETLRGYGNIDYISFGKVSKIVKYIRILRYIRKIHPDIIINNYNAVIQYLLPFIPSSIKIVHILHNNTEDFYRIGAINGKDVDGWIAPTTAIADNFNSYTQDRYKSRTIVIPHGVENASYPHKTSQDKIKELVFVGVLYEHKGAHLLPRIIEKLKECGESFHFTIIGGGKLLNKLKSDLSKDIQEGLVEMTGVISSDQVYMHLSKADIFVYPTHIDAFGLVIAEAMMNSVVPVVTLLPGITDNLVDSTKNGYLLPQDDINGFVHCITRLLHDDQLLSDLKIAARDKAMSSFSLEKMTNNYTEYLSNL